MLKHNSSISSLGNQEFPGGLVAEVTLDRTKPLDSLEVYSTAIMYIQNIGRKLPWEFEGLPSRADSKLSETQVELSVRSLAMARTRHKLQIGHVILSLYKTVNMMVDESVFRNANIMISIYGQRIRKIAFATLLHMAGITEVNHTSSGTADANMMIPV